MPSLNFSARLKGRYACGKTYTRVNSMLGKMAAISSPLYPAAMRKVTHVFRARAFYRTNLKR